MRQGPALSNQTTSLPPQSRFLRKIPGPAIIFAAALLATVPQWIRGTSCGHDFDFHLVSWFDALHSWRDGVFYPHWTPSANYGAGEPRFVFYPPLTWILGAALGAILPWRLVPGVMTFLLLAASGLATRALARRAFSEGPSTLAGCVAIFSGYTLFTAYERSAFAEMTGGFWVPLLLLFLLRDQGPGAANGNNLTVGARRPILDVSVIALTLIVAGAWLSNAPLGVMTGYLLAAVALTLALLARSWIPAIRAAFAALLGTGLAAFYLVPAAWEQRWVDIRQAVDDPGYMIENSWLFARHADPRLELHDVELLRVSAIGASMIAVALGGLLVSWLRRALPPNRRWWIPLALIPAVVLFLQLPPSLPIWNLLPKMRFLQFPWRWLVVVEAPMALFFSAAVWFPKRWIRALVLTACATLCLAATAVSMISFFQVCDEDDAVSAMVAHYRAGTGFEGSDEYAPPGADNSQVATGLPAACLVTDPQTTLGKGDPDITPDWSADQGSCRATFDWTHNQKGGSAEHWRMRAQVPQAGDLILRLRDYPAWQVRENGKPVTARPVRQDGLMALPVPAGSVDLSVDWTTTPDVEAGRLISLLSLVAITGVGLRLWQQVRTRLS
jgi:hypothetical protein